MTNHVHIVATPVNSDSMARTLNVAHMRYAQYFFKTHGGSGHLWQGRFFSTALDENHLWLCLRYIEQNPLKAGMVACAENYPWSSASGHCGIGDDQVLASDTGFSGELDGWSEVLREFLDEKVVEMIKRRTHSGIPCGDDKFLARMSKKAGCEFVERGRGRPRIENDKTP
jgi:putative transposase